MLIYPIVLLVIMKYYAADFMSTLGWMFVLQYRHYFFFISVCLKYRPHKCYVAPPNMLKGVKLQNTIFFPFSVCAILIFPIFVLAFFFSRILFSSYKSRQTLFLATNEPTHNSNYNNNIVNDFIQTHNLAQHNHSVESGIILSNNNNNNMNIMFLAFNSYILTLDSWGL